jgi:hypothetical protein
VSVDCLTLASSLSSYFLRDVLRYQYKKPTPSSRRIATHNPTTMPITMLVSTAARRRKKEVIRREKKKKGQ